MQDRVFLDTNIVIYAYSEDEPKKQHIANTLMYTYKGDIVISTQVINELSNTLFRKFKLNADDISSVVKELDANFHTVNFTVSTQLKGIELKEKYTLQFYDAMILATALENNCNLVYSEDMHHGLIVDKKLTIINPFK